ncbi:MAG TPA: winged helix DNA-binding domain-containing protein [Terriglobia bacterium]|nr:winged helix DNA-binding domain-containing protein [Terriglobia bacterium]
MPVKKRPKGSLSLSQVSAFRLRRHHLAGTSQTGLAGICRNVCGIQAQVMGAAQMALWTRKRDLTRAELHSELWERRTLVKTSCMRGTLHLLAGADFPVYIKALHAGRWRQELGIMTRYAVTADEAGRVTRAVVEELGGGPLGRRELTERALSRSNVSKKARTFFERRWWGVVRQALVEGLVCYGPDQGKEVAMVRSDRWLPKAEDVPEEEAQRVLLRRYLSAYGPATVRDFAHWAGIAMPEAKAIWTLLADEMVDLDGEAGSILQVDCDHLANAGSGEQVLRLLPSFDPYLLAHAEKGHLVDRRYYKRVYRNQGWISPVVLLNGRVIGVWSHERQGNRLLVMVELFENSSKSVRAKIEEEAVGLGEFLDASPELQLS